MPGVTLAITLTLAAAITGDSTAAGGLFTAPPPRQVAVLRREHSPRQWLFVTTESGRHEVRAVTLDSRGLSGLSARDAAPAPSWRWNEIARVDRRESRFRLGQIAGMAAGAAAGFYLGGEIAESNGSHRGQGAWMGAWAVGAAGACLGAWTGDRVVRSSPWYVADPGPLMRAPAAKDMRVESGERLRLRGTFGEFIGKAKRIDSTGFAGLVADQDDIRLPLPHEPIAWSEVSSVEVRRGSSRRWATIGAVVGAMYGVCFAVLTEMTSDKTTNDEPGKDAAIATSLSLMGAGIGAVYGMAWPIWHTAHHAPLPAAASSTQEPATP